jgi:hypothetical protein
VRVNETVSVTTDESGAPLAFSWRSNRYVIVSEPEVWFEKLPWWRQSGNVTEIPHHTVERMLWRVTALSCKGPRSLRSNAPEDALYDLCCLRSGDWLLVQTHTHMLDMPLFA